MLKKGGPRSAASLEVATLPNPAVIETVQRPDAPYDLTDEQSVEWWAIINRMPADWFPRETHGILAQYCRHIVSARRVAQLISVAEQRKKLDFREYDRLLQMQDREGRALSALATRMRLTQASTTRQETTRKPDLVDNPWEHHAKSK